MKGARDGASGVDDGDPLLYNLRRRSYSPPKASSASTAPSIYQDHDSLVSLYTSTGGGSWRTTLGWPAFRNVYRRPPRRRARSPSPSVEPPATSRNPFGDKMDITAVNGDEEKDVEAEVAGTAGAVATARALCVKSSSGDNSSGNPFVPTRKSVSPINPFRPAASSQEPSPPVMGATSTERQMEEATSPKFGKAATPTAVAVVRRAMGRFPSPTLRNGSPPSCTLGKRSVRGRSPSVSPPNVPGRSALLDAPRKRDSEVLEAGAAWFGISLGKAKRVTEVRLVDNGLVGTLPNDLDGLTMLRYLHLGRNTLSGIIPSSVADLKNLEWLNLSENILTGPMPGSLSRLTRLAELNLSSNRLTGPLPPEICSLASLVSLQLSRNALEGFLPTEISKLSSLGTLCLDHNRFSGPIPSGISGMRALKELRLNRNELTGRIPLGMGKMKCLRILSLSNNRLRGSMPEGLISNLGATKVQDFIMPGNRLADVDTAMLLLRRPLHCRSDRWLLVFSLVAAYVDLGTDVGAAMTFLSASDTLSFILAVIFIVVPTGVMVASTMGAARGRDRNKKILLTVLQLRLAWEARDGLQRRLETRDYKTAKFVEACFEAAPQMLLQTVALVSLWNDNKAKSSDIFVAFSILNSVFSVSWETMSALDRGWAEELVEERARLGTSWPCGASAHRWLMLLCLWVFHVCEVGLRGMSLAALALALRGWSALVMLGVWGLRVAIAKATEATDLKTTKVLIKALAACLLDSIWDRKAAYVIASVCTLVESSVFFVVAAVELGDESTPLGQAMSDAAWAVGGIYALRWALDLWLRVPLHWGKLFDSNNLVMPCRCPRSREEALGSLSNLTGPAPGKSTAAAASATATPATESPPPPQALSRE